jgi:hypothetical protein
MNKSKKNCSEQEEATRCTKKNESALFIEYGYLMRIWARSNFSDSTGTRI